MLNLSPDSTRVVLHVDGGAIGTEPLKRAFRRANQNLNLSFQCVSCGAEATQYVRGEGIYGDRARHPKPDLVVLDNLAPADTFKALRNIYTEVEAKGMRTIVLLSSPRLDYRAKAWELGASGYIVKTGRFATETAELAQHFLRPEPPGKSCDFAADPAWLSAPGEATALLLAQAGTMEGVSSGQGIHNSAPRIDARYAACTPD